MSEESDSEESAEDGEIAWDPSRNQSRARARPVSKEGREERVRRIMDLMAAGAWRASMALSLGDEWGVKESAVQAYSAEASRRLRSFVGDKADVEAKIEMLVDRAVEMAALEDRMPSKGAEVLIKAGDLLMRLKGVGGPTKLEHSGPDGGPIPTAIVLFPEEDKGG
jgi:hypothetical protein